MKTKKWMKGGIWAAFVFYCLALVFILLLDARGHRYQGESLMDYLRFSVNLVPFQTIGEYLLRIGRDSAYFTLAVRNIGGNFILFLPMGIFLPMLFSAMRKFWKTSLTIFGMVLSAEMLQLLLRRGIFDIDDFILNMAGAVLGYFIYKLLHKIYCKIITSCGILSLTGKEGVIDGDQTE